MQHIICSKLSSGAANSASLTVFVLHVFFKSYLGWSLDVCPYCLGFDYEILPQAHMYLNPWFPASGTVLGWRTWGVLLEEMGSQALSDSTAPFLTFSLLLDLRTHHDQPRHPPTSLLLLILNPLIQFVEEKKKERKRSPSPLSHFQSGIWSQWHWSN